MTFFKAIIATLIILVSGCFTDALESDRAVGASIHAISDTNSMPYSRVSVNGLSFRLLTQRPLSTERVSVNSLELNDVTGIEETPEGRELLQYIARCALNETDFLVTEHEGVSYQMQGLLALAPEWENRSLSDEERRWMSACLIAHVNAYAVSVPISLRAPGKLGGSPSEMTDYPVYEGTFFGDISSLGFETYACIGDMPSVALAHSTARSLRVCTDPTNDCDVQSVGRCRDVCTTRTPDLGWQDCSANGQVFHETISVYLRDFDLEGLNQTCLANDTETILIAHQGAGIMGTGDALSCEVKCKQESICTIDGTRSTELSAIVKQDSIAQVSCHEAEECGAVCKSGSLCEIDCKDADSCDDIKCKGGAECLLDCTGAVDCGFDVCHGTTTTCPGDIIVCNRPCP